jgi:hypothetical protein
MLFKQAFALVAAATSATAAATPGCNADNCLRGIHLFNTCMNCTLTDFLGRHCQCIPFPLGICRLLVVLSNNCYTCDSVSKIPSNATSNILISSAL